MATGDKIVNVDGLKAVHDRDERAIAVKYRTADTDFDYGELKVGGINKDNAYTSGTNQRRVETYWPVIDDEITIQMSGGLTGYLRLYDSNKTMIDPDASLPGANTTNHYVLIGKNESLTLRMKDYNVNAAYFRFTMSSGTEEIAEALIPENARFIMPKNVATQEDVDELQNKNMPNIWGLFRNAVCIGDSLTRGYLSAYASKERNRDYGYPSALARLTGMNVWNYGLSGSDPGEWVADATMAAQDYSKFDVAFVSFGQNIDKSGGGSYTESEYEELYMSVLQRLKTANSNMVIFCLSNPGPRAVNGWIQDFVATATNQSGTYAYQYVYYLDVSTDAPYTSHRTDGTHLDALGYSMLAECVKIAVEKLYAQNPTAVYIPKTVDNIITKPVNPPCLLEDKVEDIEDSVGTLESDVSDLKSNVTNIKTAIGESELTPEQDKSIQIGDTNRIVLPENIESNEGYCCLCIPCKPGDVFVVTGRYGAGYNSMRVWGFSNKIGKALSMANDAITATDLIVTAPENSAYFCYNSSLSEPHKVIKKGYPTLNRIVDGFQSKIDVSQGEENSSKDIVTDEQGNIIADYPRTNFVLNRVKCGLVEDYEPKSINTSGVIQYDINGNYWITNKIPLESGKIYIPDGSIYRSATFTENDEFVSLNRHSINGLIPNANEAYIILCVTDANKGKIQFYELDDADFNLKYQPYSYKEITESGVKSIQKITERYAEKDSVRFVKSHNLFNYIEDELFFGGTGGVIAHTDGTFSLNNTITITKRVRDKTGAVENNGRAASLKYYPVQPGDVLVSNMYIWSSAYYDENYTYAGEIPPHDAYQGWRVPEGCAYVRLNFKTSTTPSLDAITTIDDCKRILIYTIQSNYEIHPQKKFAPHNVLDGSNVSPNYLDKVVPSMNESEWLSSMKGLSVREKNAADNIYRFANFNMWVMMGITGWENTRRMLMDYGVDFCGLEEVVTQSGSFQMSVADYMKSWQFKDGFEPDRTAEHVCNKGLLSRFTLTSAEEIILASAPSDQYNNRSCICCKVTLPRRNDIIEPVKTLSMYVLHAPITSAEVQANVGDELLGIIAEDDSDFIVIMSDTNDFGKTLEGKVFWQKLISGGFTTSIPVTTKTITQDNLTVASGSTVEETWCGACIDQIFVSSNIEVKNYGVLNTKEKYYVDGGHTSSATDNEYALSDHDFVFADLKFNYDTPRSGLQV